MNYNVVVIDRLIQSIEHAGRLARKPVEQATGYPFRLVEEGKYFRTYAADPIHSGKFDFSFDLREPVPNSGATGGALLVVKVAGGCAAKSTLEARYGGWQLTEAPHGRSPYEQTYFTHIEPWGELSFGFAEKAPDCLRSVVFKAADPR